VSECGGCQGLGAHRRYCPQHPDYHPWRVLADRAEDIGDRIGGSDPGLANQAYFLAGAIRRAMPDHPYRRPQPKREALDDRGQASVRDPRPVADAPP
jgi:hypothetical protein